MQGENKTLTEMKEDISELQSKVKDLEDKINILSKLIEVDLELELDIYRRKQLKPRGKNIIDYSTQINRENG